MNRKTVVFLLILFLTAGSAFPFGIDLVKALNLLSKISGQMSSYSGILDEHYRDFIQFYREKWEKFHEKFSGDDLRLFDLNKNDLRMESHIDPEKTGPVWEKILSDPRNLRKEFPDLFYFGHYKNRTEGSEDGIAKESMEADILDESGYLKDIESMFTLLMNSRKAQMIRLKKIGDIRQYIKNFSKPAGRDEVRMGRLIGLEAILEKEIGKQIVELISLVNAQTELEIRSELIHKNMMKRNKVIGRRLDGIAAGKLERNRE